MRTFHRLRLFFLVITPTLAILHFYTYYSVETWHPHQKHIQAFATRYRKLGSEYAFGGGGRN
jgi:hypothetical protein